MPESAKHPPKPVLTYRLGVAGTRDLSEAHPTLESRIKDVLNFVKERVYAIFAENPELFDPTHKPRLILLCSLAKGVDLLVAELAQTAGYELHVPLAFHRKAYARLNFGRGESDDKTLFGKLLPAAGAVFELDGDETLSDTSAAYDASGTVLVTHSDALLAIWDGGPGKGAGGTADSVRKAKEAGIPVLRMRHDEPGEPVFDDDGAVRSLEELKPFIRDRLLPGIDSVRERKRLLRYYKEREWRLELSWPFQLANSALSLRHPRLRFRLPPYSKSTDGEWRPITSETFKDPARTHFKRFDQWADGLAVFYANWMRSTVATTLFLGSALLAYALALKLWPDLEKWDALPRFEGVAMLALTLLVAAAKLRGVHSRWLQYRMLSEFLRSAALAAAIGGLPLPHSHFRESGKVAQSWVAFYFQAVIRSMGLPSAVLDKAYLADFRQLLMARLKSQVRFHRDRQSLYEAIDGHARVCGYFIFGISFAGAVLQVLNTAFPDAIGRLIGSVWQGHLTNMSLILPVVGAALVAFVAQESFGRLSHLSGTVATRLENIVTRIDRMEAKRELLRDATAAAIDEMMAEHEEWFMLYSLRDIELPH